MERIPEPELMEDDEQARAYAEADFTQPHSSFIAFFQELFGTLRGTVLDLGCGPGDISTRFARAYPGCIVHGVDGSEAMLAYGRRLLESAPDIRDRVQLMHGVLPAVQLPIARYDTVISNSLLHHLSNPQVLWDSVKRYARAEAPLYIMDLIRPQTIGEARCLTEIHAGKEPEVLRRDFYNSLLAAFEPEEIRRQLQEAGLEHLSLSVVSDRHVVIAGRMR